jgi:hypothetical protein
MTGLHPAPHRRRGLRAALLALLLAAGCAGPLPDPVGHEVDVHARPWSTELAPEIKLVPLELPPGAERKAVAVSPDGRLRAFIMETPRDPEGQIELVCIEQVESGQTLAVRSVPMPWRPYSGLAWPSNRYLVFDRWSQPHYGMHYVVDVREMRLAHAAPFPDRFFLEQQRSQK